MAGVPSAWAQGPMDDSAGDVASLLQVKNQFITPSKRSESLGNLKMMEHREHAPQPGTKPGHRTPFPSHTGNTEWCGLPTSVSSSIKWAQTHVGNDMVGRKGRGKRGQKGYCWGPGVSTRTLVCLLVDGSPGDPVGPQVTNISSREH